MINPFFKNHGPITLKKIFELSDTSPKKQFSNIEILDIKDLVTAKIENITFFHSKKYEDLASKTKAAFCITTKNLSHILPKSCEAIIVDNVLIATAKITKIFYPDAVSDDFDSMTSDISEMPLGKTVKHGSNVLIGLNVQIGKKCSIGHNSIIESNVIIGDNCTTLSSRYNLWCRE